MKELILLSDAKKQVIRFSVFSSNWLLILDIKEKT